MNFKETPGQFAVLDIASIEPDAASPRHQIDEESLKGLCNSIKKVGVIHPLVVQPQNAAGRYTLIVGERRWRAAVMAGEISVPVLIRGCGANEVLDVQVSENMGSGMRTALAPRAMANAIQAISERFETPDAAAEHFGESRSWLNQATAAANLSPKITALLDSGKISSTGTAIQLEKLSKKNEAKAVALISELEQLPEGGKLTRKTVDKVLSGVSTRRKIKSDIPTATDSVAGATWAGQSAGFYGISPAKVRQVATLLGLPDGDDATVLSRLIDQFLAQEAPPF
ncbi:MAG: ParB/RepB/Spo0J family partition protein [Gallionella sp.]|jgi:ParB family chromosome partitioning protein